jgi:hypothetical protein
VTFLLDGIELPEMSCALTLIPIFIFRPQPQCNFDLFLTGGHVGNYPVIDRSPDFDPNRAMHGGGISQDKYWFFYFEVMMTWTSGTSADWRFFVSSISSGRYVLDLGNGKTEAHSFFVTKPNDNPGAGEVDLTSLSRYLFYDAPGFNMFQKGDDGLRHPVIKLSMTVSLSFRGVRNGRPGCNSFVFLSLKIEPGKPPDWQYLTD